ncbi:kinase-like protein [Rhizodiscina lignyota]|uniref:non-specific serine/threonine protein kinase n=1 Tax=Rhizodiscina lignyota TaxID=1504668 RepID=A0A9P4MAD5_9PEZI|nr:kinase-like protein [Rhizodiscina lignyota]
MANLRVARNYFFRVERAQFRQALLAALPDLPEGEIKRQERNLARHGHGVQRQWRNMPAAQKNHWAALAATNQMPGPPNPGLQLAAQELNAEIFAAQSYNTGNYTEAQLIVLNRTIETVRGRKLANRELANWARNVSTWDVFSTPHRRRWWRHWRALQAAGTMQATNGLKDMKNNLAVPDLSRWEREARRLEARRRRKRAIYAIHFTYGHIRTHIRQQRLAEAMATTGGALTAAQQAAILAENWTPWRVLGDGAQGAAVHWIQLGVNDNTVRRWAVKCGKIPPNRAHLLAPALLNNVPEECWNSQRAANHAGRLVPWYKNSLLLPAHGPGAPQQWFMPMEYMPYGDLHDLIHLHSVQGTSIPEPFIWLCLRRLAGIGALTGNVTSWRPPIGQTSLLHLDVKPTNIFLGDYPLPNPPDPYPAYPYPFLADWGIAEARPLPHTLIHIVGTPIFAAPEQFPANNLNRPVSSRTDVWGIGMVLFCLMENEPYPPWLRHQTQNPGDPTNHVFSPTAVATYSSVLRDLALECMNLNDTLRRTPQYLQMFADALIQVGNMEEANWTLLMNPVTLGAPTAALFAARSPTWGQIFFSPDDHLVGQPPPADA